jgi:hypothetical protein
MWGAIVVDVVAFAVVGITLSIVVCMLARSAISWYSTETDAVSVADGTKLLDYTVDHPEHGMVVQMAGFLLHRETSLRSRRSKDTSSFDPACPSTRCGQTSFRGGSGSLV